MSNDSTQTTIAGCFPVELERKQDEVLQQLDQLNDNILTLLDEFAERLKDPGK